MNIILKAMNTPRIYQDANGNPCPLLHLIKQEPEWAENQILQRDKLERELAEEKEAYQQMEMMANKLHGEIVAVTAERDALKSARDRAQEDWAETTRLYRAVKIERDALLRGEYICKKCGVRKDGEGVEGDF